MKLKHLHYGWVMVVLSAFVIASQALVVYSFGVFLRPITTEFNWERGALSGAFSTAMLMMGFFSILSGRLSDKYGPRVLASIYGLLVGTGFLLMSRITSLWQAYLIWGLLVGIGSSCCYVPITSCIPRWFAKKTGMAIGITVTGFGLGGLVSPPLAQWLISAYGWQQAFLILGIVIFIIVLPLAQFMKHSPQRVGLEPYGGSVAMQDKPSLVEGGLSIKQVIKTKAFWLFGLVLFCFFFCIQVIIVHIVPHAIDIGISPIIAASITSIIAGISICGRLSMGFVSDKTGGRLLLVVCVSLAALALFWLLFAKEAWMFYVFAVIFGLAYGGIVSLQTVTSAELFGVSSLGIIMATLMFYGTIGGALGAPLAGSIFDRTGNYGLAFVVCVIICGMASVLTLVLLRVRGWRDGN